MAISSPEFVQNDTWIKKSNMPTARMGHDTCVLDGKIYAIGGYPIADAPGLTTVEVYDPVTDSWTKKSDMPTERFSLAACVVGENIFVIAGASGFNALPKIEI
jgi:N-acetylneuraminic acid mutarotase